MSDLTDEEIIATRKLNGVDDDLYRKIDIGEYIRTKNGYIIRVDENTNIFNFGYKEQYVDMETTRYGFTYEDEIVKHSKQLIDLIEVGDFVNGYRVLAIEDSIYKNSKRILIYKNQKEKYERWIYIQEYDGKIYRFDPSTDFGTLYRVGGEDE